MRRRGLLVVTGLLALVLAPAVPAATDDGVTVTITGPPSIHAGDSFPLSWSSTGATKCSLSGPWTDPSLTATSGTETIATAWDDHSTRVFGVSCTGSGGTGTYSWTLSAPPPIASTTPAPTATVPAPTASTAAPAAPEPAVTTTAAAAPGSYPLAVSGTVSCQSHPVEGIWVDSSFGGSGWATWAPAAAGSTTAQYSFQFTSQAPYTLVRLHVGCGGTSSQWWSDNWTGPRVLKGTGHAFDVYCDEGTTPPAGGDNKRCKWGARPVPKAPVSATPSPAAYPWSSAPCEFGPAGGAACKNPKNSGDLYDWYVDENKNGRLDVARGTTCGTDSAAAECFDQWGYEYRNCTSYVAWRLSSSKTSFDFLGDARDWLAGAARRKGVGISKRPTVGAVAVWKGHDHVAYVEKIDKGTVYVSDFNGGDHYGAYWPSHPLTSTPDGYIVFPAKK